MSLAFFKITFCCNIAQFLHKRTINKPILKQHFKAIIFWRVM